MRMFALLHCAFNCHVKYNEEPHSNEPIHNEIEKESEWCGKHIWWSADFRLALCICVAFCVNVFEYFDEKRTKILGFSSHQRKSARQLMNSVPYDRFIFAICFRAPVFFKFYIRNIWIVGWWHCAYVMIKIYVVPCNELQISIKYQEPVY